MSFLRRNRHPADETLLLLLEGELRGRRLIRTQRHVSTCSDCRARNVVLMEVSTEVRTAAPREVSTPAARERLALGLAHQAQADAVDRLTRVRRSSVLRPSVLLRAAVVIALLLVAVAWRQLDLPLQDRMAAYEGTGPKPNHALTPGSSNPVALTELCGLSDADLDPRVSPDKQLAVFRAYGLAQSAARAYQIDYLINPQLGGNDRLENLWPEPYHATVWNARAKDALETRLHSMVCSGQVDLQVAQQDLSTDWIAAYKKYFHTQRPVITVAQLDLPRPSAGPLP